MSNDKRISDSEVELNQLMLPQHANPLGNVHGGVIMKLVDEAAGLCAVRHARKPVVTIAIDSMTFHSPVHLGNLLTLKARINWIGHTSVEIGVRVVAEDPLTGIQTHTNSAYLVFVALDEQGKPTSIPPVTLETEDEHRRWREGAVRQQRRLAADNNH
ncbi:MAG: acyl-CoA thioesterase [Chloroflexota bacterium]